MKYYLLGAMLVGYYTFQETPAGKVILQNLTLSGTMEKAHDVYKRIDKQQLGKIYDLAHEARVTHVIVLALFFKMLARVMKTRIQKR